MSRQLRLLLVTALLLALLPVQPALAQSKGQAATANCFDGIQASGAVYRICMPAMLPWNGSLVIYAHGYVAVTQPIGIPEDQLVLPDGTSIPDIVTGLGFAFATTSYSVNGLAINEGIADIVDLVSVFTNSVGPAYKIYLVGASEGGLITTLAVERYPQVFSGGLSTCGPVGDFRGQVNYWGDFRVIFDYFFRNLLPPSPVDIPEEVMQNWDSYYVPRIQAAITASTVKTSQLLSVSRAPTDPGNPASIGETVLGLLWYNAFATNDGVAKLQGQPFDNSTRWYFGSRNDFLLNRKIQRFTADPTALANIQANYQTSGKLQIPLVNLHTTGDPIVPYWHTALYLAKVLKTRSLRNYTAVPILRYGHCNFKASEVLLGFALLVLKSNGPELQNIEKVLPDDTARLDFQRMARDYDLR